MKWERKLRQCPTPSAMTPWCRLVCKAVCSYDRRGRPPVRVPVPLSVCRSVPRDSLATTSHCYGLIVFVYRRRRAVTCSVMCPWWRASPGVWSTEVCATGLWTADPQTDRRTPRNRFYIHNSYISHRRMHQTADGNIEQWPKQVDKNCNRPLLKRKTPARDYSKSRHVTLTNTHCQWSTVYRSTLKWNVDR